MFIVAPCTTKQKGVPKNGNSASKNMKMDPYQESAACLHPHIAASNPPETKAQASKDQSRATELFSDTPHIRSLNPMQEPKLLHSLIDWKMVIPFKEEHSRKTENPLQAHGKVKSVMIFTAEAHLKINRAPSLSNSSREPTTKPIKKCRAAPEIARLTPPNAKYRRHQNLQRLQSRSL